MEAIPPDYDEATKERLYGQEWLEYFFFIGRDAAMRDYPKEYATLFPHLIPERQQLLAAGMFSGDWLPMELAGVGEDLPPEGHTNEQWDGEGAGKNTRNNAEWKNIYPADGGCAGVGMRHGFSLEGAPANEATFSFVVTDREEAMKRFVEDDEDRKKKRRKRKKDGENDYMDDNSNGSSNSDSDSSDLWSDLASSDSRSSSLSSDSTDTNQDNFQECLIIESIHPHTSAETVDAMEEKESSYKKLGRSRDERSKRDVEPHRRNRGSSRSSRPLSHRRSHRHRRWEGRPKDEEEEKVSGVEAKESTGRRRYRRDSHGRRHHHRVVNKKDDEAEKRKRALHRRGNDHSREELKKDLKEEEEGLGDERREDDTEMRRARSRDEEERDRERARDRHRHRRRSRSRSVEKAERTRYRRLDEDSKRQEGEPFSSSTFSNTRKAMASSLASGASTRSTREGAGQGSYHHSRLHDNYEDRKAALSLPSLFPPSSFTKQKQSTVGSSGLVLSSTSHRKADKESARPDGRSRALCSSAYHSNYALREEKAGELDGRDGHSLRIGKGGSPDSNRRGADELPAVGNDRKQ